MKYSFRQWLWDSILWCLFLSLFVFTLHGVNFAWVGMIMIVAFCYFPRAVRKASQNQPSEHRSIFFHLKMIMQYFSMAISQMNVTLLERAEEQKVYTEEALDKLDSEKHVTALSININFPMMITVFCSIVTVIILEYLY